MKPVSKFVSGHVVLDFCNTAGEHLAERFDEMLIDWETFVRWCVQAGVVAETSYGSLARKRSPMEPVIRLRECIYRAGLALARHESIAARHLAEIVRTAKGDLPTVHADADGIHWQPKAEHGSEQLRALLAREALSLFCSPRASRIGVCEGGACGWLFLDDSRGKRRRWCDMKDCGSRAKARSFYERHKGAGAGKGK